MESKKKIGIFALCSKADGGVYQYTISILDALSNDYSNDYILYVADDRLFSNYRFEKRIVPVINRGFQKYFNYVALFFNVNFFFKKNTFLYKDLHFIISTNTTFSPIYFLGIPYIYTLHDLQEEYYPNFFSRKDLWLRRLINRRMSHKSLMIICESNAVKCDIVRFHKVEASKIQVLPSPASSNFNSLIFSDELKIQVRNKYNLPDKYIFYPAQSWQHKNHLNLLRAFKLIAKDFDNLKLVFSGGKTSYYSIIQNEIDVLNLKGNVIHLGYIDEFDFPYVYKMSEFLVMPSLFESISIPVIEAFSLQIPVCASNFESIQEQIGSCGLCFNPNDPVDISEKMKAYLSDENLKCRFALAGYEKSRSFDYDSYRAKLISCFK